MIYRTVVYHEFSCAEDQSVQREISLQRDAAALRKGRRYSKEPRASGVAGQATVVHRLLDCIPQLQETVRAGATGKQ